MISEKLFNDRKRRTLTLTRCYLRLRLPSDSKESFFRLSRSRRVNRDACFVTNRNRSSASGYETTVYHPPTVLCRTREDLLNIEKRSKVLSKANKRRKKCDMRDETRRNGSKARRCACNGNSYGLDSLIKFSIHIHSFARRKSIQVASSLCYQLLVSLDDRVGGEKRVWRVSCVTRR